MEANGAFGLGWGTVWVLWLVGFLVACGGNSKPADESGPQTAEDTSASSGVGGGSSSEASTNASSVQTTASSTATTGSDATTGSGASGGGASDLSGTWDVIVSNQNGEALASTVTLSPTLLETTGDLEMLALVADDIVNIAYEGDSARATRQASGDLDLGVLPLPLAGVLRFTGVPDNGNGCDFSLESGALTLACTEGISSPGGLPELQNADLSAVRSEPLDSIFEDLGGRWTVTAEDVDCQVVLESNTITASCREAGSDSREVTITVDGDRISGSMSGGVEFTAQRR